MEREKSILKQGAVQHLYGRLAGTLRGDAGDANLLVNPQLNWSYSAPCSTCFAALQRRKCALDACICHVIVAWASGTTSLAEAQGTCLN